MALIKCPECGKENISDTAKSCPQCGYNIKKHFKDNSRHSIAKKAIKICVISALSVVVICAAGAGAIKAINNNLQEDAYELIYKGDFNKAISKSEKIICNDDLKTGVKNDVILYSYMSDCKRAMLEYSNSKFNRWFSENGACSKNFIEFYDSSRMDIYNGYPVCILTAPASLNDLSEDHYIFFTYDTETKHYEVHEEISGLDQEDISVEDDDLANTMQQNRSREYIEAVFAAYPEIKIYWLKVLISDDDDYWKEAELLDSYNNYF